LLRSGEGLHNAEPPYVFLGKTLLAAVPMPSNLRD
jgi:hypothetical protein